MFGIEIGGEGAGDDIARIADIVGIDAIAQRVGVVGAGIASAGFVDIVARQQDAQPVGRFEQELQAAGVIIFGFGNVDAGDRADIVIVAVVAEDEAGEAHRSAVTDRHIDHAAQRRLIIIAIFAFDLGIPDAQTRLPRDDVDRTGGSVAPAQRALRTDIDLDPLDIEKGRTDAGGARQIDALEMRRGCGIAQFGIVARSDAADPHFDIAAIIGDGQPGQDVVEIGQILDTAPLQIVAAEAGGGAGEILEPLFAPVGSDDDVAFARLFILCGGGRWCGILCEGGTSHRRRRGAQQIDRPKRSHRLSPLMADIRLSLDMDIAQNCERSQYGK